MTRRLCPLAAGVRLLPETGGLHGENPPALSALWEVVNQIGGKERYFFGNLLWQTRGTMDLLVGHRLAKGRPARPYLEVGDAVDSWKGDHRRAGKAAGVVVRYESAGLGRLCFTLKDKGDRRNWTSAPGGTRTDAGPVLLAVDDPRPSVYLPGMAKRIAQLAEQKTKITH
jgi:hypothetical protein